MQEQSLFKLIHKIMWQITPQSQKIIILQEFNQLAIRNYI